MNTTDSRVELSWDVVRSAVLADWQRARLVDRLGARLVDGGLTVAASEYRSQWRNRQAARERMSRLVSEALAPPPPRRRATRPSRRATERRLADKRNRGDVKRGRGNRRPGEE